MNRFFAGCFYGALLYAAPVFSQSPIVATSADPQVKDSQFRWFSMGDNRQSVAAALGPPAVVADFGSDYQSWQYRVQGTDEHDFSHQFVFLKSSGELVSVSRNYEPARTVDAFFPVGETKVCKVPTPEGPLYGVRMRKLADGGVLLAMGTASQGQPTGQLMLIRNSSLRFFYPKLEESCKAGK